MALERITVNLYALVEKLPETGYVEYSTFRAAALGDMQTAHLARFFHVARRSGMIDAKFEYNDLGDLLFLVGRPNQEEVEDAD